MHVQRAMRGGGGRVPVHMQSDATLTGGSYANVLVEPLKVSSGSPRASRRIV